MPLTNYVVAVLILHHQLQRTRAIAMQSCQLCHDGLPLLISPELDALLDDIRGKLVLR